MVKLKRNILFIVFSLICSNGILEAQYRKELSVHLGGGMSSMQYGVGGGNFRPGFGGNSGISYRRFFLENFGLGTGLELAVYSAVFRSDEFNFSQWSNDGYHPFEFRSTGNTREKQTAVMMQIPLMMHFQTKYNDNKFCTYFAFGFKFGVPLFGTYKIRGKYLNSGYYPYEDYIYTEQRFRGFGKYSERLNRGSLGLNPVISIPLAEENTLDLPLAALLTAEVGLKWKIQSRKSKQFTNLIYTGLYLDYGLNNLSSQEERPYNPAVEPNYSNNNFNLNTHSIFPDNVIPVSVGIRVHFTHGYGTVRELPPPKEKIIVMKKRTVKIRQKCDCCRICLFKKKPDYRCQEETRSIKRVYRYR